MTTGVRRLGAIVWFVWMMAAIAILATRLEVDGDLTAFLPTAPISSPSHASSSSPSPSPLPAPSPSPSLRALLDDGFQAQWLLVGIRGDISERERAARQLARALRDSGLFDDVVDGRPPPVPLGPPDPRRYLLVEPGPLDAPHLHQAIAAQQRRLASPIPVDPVALRHDPTDVTPRLAALAALAPPPPPSAPHASDPALSVLALRAKALGDRTQAAPLLAHLSVALDEIEAGGLRTLMTGPTVFAAQSEARVRAEISRLMTWAGLAVALVLFIAFRPALPALLTLLPPLTGMFTGLAIVTLVFGEVHGIAIAFASILIGVSVDYPIHIMSHHPRRQGIARTLLLSALTSIAALLSWLFSGVPGLIQAGVLTGTGLAAALATSLLIVPTQLDHAPTRPRVRPFTFPRVAPGLSRWSSLTVMLVATVVFLFQGPAFNDRPALTGLVDSEHLAADQTLRSAIGLPDASHRIVVVAPDLETLLQRQERLAEQLDAAVSEGLLGHAAGAWRLLPSKARQNARQQALPDRAALERTLTQALDGTAFHGDTFAPFLDDIAQAKNASALDAETLTAVAPDRAELLAQFVIADGHSFVGPILLGGLDAGHVAPLRQRLEAADLQGWRWVDVGEEVRASLARTRTQASWLAAGGLALVLLLLVHPRISGGHALLDRTVLPMLAALFGTLAILRLIGEEIGLFHIAALVLAAGLTADYRLFLGRHNTPEQGARTAHGLVVSILSSASVFALLALSSIPVLHALGMTIVIAIALALLPEWLCLLQSRMRKPS